MDSTLPNARHADPGLEAWYAHKTRRRAEANGFNFGGYAEYLDRLADHLDTWNGGQFDADNKDQRQAATDAVDTIDTLIRALQERRARTVTEIRRYDDESLARTDALLARIRAERDGGEPA